VSAPIERFGDAAFRLRIPSGANARVLLGALLAVPDVLDAIVAEEHVLVTFAPSTPPELEALASAVRDRQVPADPVASRTERVVAVRYDGPDLDELARACGMTVGEVIRAHTGATYEVAFLGFLPGFAYLRGLDPRLVVPRRATPRPRVGALSLGIAGPYTGIYPFASPGGWNLLGTVKDFAPFDTSTGARLQLGDRVRFIAEDA
jgi:UPF0271 protein